MAELPEGERLSYTIWHKDRGDVQQVVADLTKPFFVGRNSRFRGVDRFGYLPPILRPAKPDDSAIVDELLDMVRDLRARLTKHINEKPNVGRRPPINLSDPF